MMLFTIYKTITIIHYYNNSVFNFQVPAKNLLQNSSIILKLNNIELQLSLIVNHSTSYSFILINTNQFN